MNTCNRCNRSLKDPRADYGWRCAQILGVQAALNSADDKTWNAFINGMDRAKKNLEKINKLGQGENVNHAEYLKYQAAMQLSLEKGDIESAEEYHRLAAKALDGEVGTGDDDGVVVKLLTADVALAGNTGDLLEWWRKEDGVYVTQQDKEIMNHVDYSYMEVLSKKWKNADFAGDQNGKQLAYDEAQKIREKYYGAVVLLNQSKGAGGFEHMAMLIQDKKGDWYFFSWQSTVELTKVSYDIAKNWSSLNQFLIDKGINYKTDVPYDRSVFIKGDFNETLSVANELKYAFENRNDPEQYSKFYTKFADGERVYNMEYSLANNCGQVAMQSFMKGTLDSGISIEGYLMSFHGYGTTEKMLGYDKYNESIIPMVEMAKMKQAFYNDALSYQEYKSTMQKHITDYEQSNQLSKFRLDSKMRNINKFYIP